MLNRIVELGYVVEDLSAAMGFFERNLGVSSFSVTKNLTMNAARYCGKPIELNIDVAMGAAGGVVIELIKQHGDQPSPFNPPGNNDLFVFNHWSLFVDNLDEALQGFLGRGCREVFCAEIGAVQGAKGARVVYLSDPENSAGYIELMETDSPVLLDAYTKILNP